MGRLHFRSSFEWESAITVITVINKYYTSTHTKDYQPIIKEIDKNKKKLPGQYTVECVHGLNIATVQF